MNDSAAYPDETDGDAAHRSLPDDLRRLAEDAKAFAAAELAYQKSRAAFAGQEARRIALLGLFAAVFVFFALMALTVGLVIALVPILTAWGATGAVFGGLLLVAAVLLFSALGRWKRMTALLSDKPR